MDSAPETATPPNSSKRRNYRFGIIVGIIAIIGVVVTITIPVLDDKGCRCGTPRQIDASNLRQIGQSILVELNEHPETIAAANPRDIHEIAVLLARENLLTHATTWFSGGGIYSGADEIVPVNEWPKTIVDPSPSDGIAPINPQFEVTPLAFAVAIFPPGTKLDDLHDSTPLAWTRGLQSNGKWSKAIGTYGDWGGFVYFVGNNVEKYEGGIKGRLVKFGTNEPTSNILEALPPGSRTIEFTPTKK